MDMMDGLEPKRSVSSMMDNNGMNSNNNSPFRLKDNDEDRVSDIGNRTVSSNITTVDKDINNDNKADSSNMHNSHNDSINNNVNGKSRDTDSR
jgi:hypothetical protein